MITIYEQNGTFIIEQTEIAPLFIPIINYDYIINGSDVTIFDKVNPDRVSITEIFSSIFKLDGSAIGDNIGAAETYLRSFKVVNGGSNALTGWAKYTDNQYTSDSPLVVTEGNETILDINGATTIKSQLPEGITDLYDVETSKLLGINSGDAYLLRFDAKIFTSNPSGLAKLKIDIGGAQGVILNQPINFPKGTGLSNVNNYNTTLWYYSLDTFVLNGGDIIIESVTGDTSIFDISINPSRIHKAR
mgnify:CR=1 FL=1